MKFKSIWLFVTGLVLILGNSAVQESRNVLASTDDPPGIGPYTEIQLPLEDLPALNENLAFHPVIDSYPGGATLQVMYVLEDPRDVPMARFAYNSKNFGVVAPINRPASGAGSPEYDALSAELQSYSPKTINVYVRVQAPDDQKVSDPLLAAQNINHDEGYFTGHRYNEDRPALFTIPIFSDLEEFSLFPCSATEYADGTSPYPLPAEIDGGDAVGKDGLYDPQAYAPPQPWYYSSNEMLEPGEVREGWISCMAPDMPLEELQIRAWYHFVHPPEPTPTPGPSPTPWPTSDPENVCPVVESLDDPLCEEAGCCIVSLIEIDPTTEALLNATPDIALQATYEAERYLPRDDIGERIAWSYANVKRVPEDGIRMDNASLVFTNEKGEEKTAQGSVIFRDPKVMRIEKEDVSYTGYDFKFIASFEFVTEALTEDELQEFSLDSVGAYIEMFDGPVAPFVNTSYGEFSGKYKYSLQSNYDTYGAKLWVNNITGYIYTWLNNDNDRTLGYQIYEEQKMPVRPDLWFSIVPADKDITSVPFLFPAKGINIYNRSLESKTSMCDFVDCLDVKDPKDERAVVRTVPMLCAGEWANNFIIDGLDIRVLDYIGEPYGLRNMYAPSLFRYSSERAHLYEVEPRTWLYSGRIMGGLTPWWGKDIWGFRNIRILDGYIVDLRSGLFFKDPTLTLPYFQEFDQGYYVSTHMNHRSYGWVPGIVDKNLLIYGIVRENEYSHKNTGYLFIDEGPIWTTSCQRDLLPSHVDQEQYAPPEIDVLANFEGNQHEMAAMLPGMVYPISQPNISGEILSLGEAGDPIAGYVITPKEVKVIRGKPNEPVVYVPSEDKTYPATEKVNINNEVFFSRVGAVVIPPDSSFIMVKFKAEFDENLPYADDQPRCRIGRSDLQLSYPGYYPISSMPAWKDIIEGWVCRATDYESWLYFKFPSLDFDQEKMLITARGSSVDPWNLWRLEDK